MESARAAMTCPRSDPAPDAYESAAAFDASNADRASSEWLGSAADAPEPLDAYLQFFRSAEPI
jgi:hypothetical protein